MCQAEGWKPWHRYKRSCIFNTCFWFTFKKDIDPPAGARNRRKATVIIWRNPWCHQTDKLRYIYMYLEFNKKTYLYWVRSDYWNILLNIFIFILICSFCLLLVRICINFSFFTIYSFSYCLKFDKFVLNLFITIFQK